MIKELFVDNFKALNQFRIEFTPLTVLIGGNACGKSTVLQALDLMCNFAQKDIDAYLELRNWSIGDLKSQFNNKRTMTFKGVFEIPIADKKKTLSWEFSFNTVLSQNRIQISRESVVEGETNRVLLERDTNQMQRYNRKSGQVETYPNFGMNSSILKTIDMEKEKEKFPELVALKNFLVSSDSFELLSPEKMRKSNRGKASSIGMAGEKLPAFIQSLNKEKKNDLLKRLNKHIAVIEDIDTVVKGRPGWIELIIKEKFGENSAKIKSAYVSDGLMRIIALAALSEIDSANGFMLLDEIEDGINPYLAAEVVKSLKDIAESSQRQIIVTTHSSILLDYFDKETIVFMWRQKDGNIRAARLFDNPEMVDMLEYMYPGEVWVNMSESQIVEKLEQGKQ